MKTSSLLAVLLLALSAPANGAETPAAAPTATLVPGSLTIRKLTEKKVSALPPGPLFWRVENFDSLEQARAAAGEFSLAAESAGKAWLFTLGPAGSTTAGGASISEVGPIAAVAAQDYTLLVNEATGAPGKASSVHTHPGSEAFFVLQGEQRIRMANGVMVVKAGQPEAGHGADMPMQVASSGTEDLHALVMFVLDASRPFSSPATFPVGTP
ncbi:MAG: cupin domain-containing protein [Pseudoxanthomonas sp.]